MKTISIEVRIDDFTGKMGTVMKQIGFGSEESVDVILQTIGILDSLKQNMLNKLNTKMARVK